METRKCVCCDNVLNGDDRFDTPMYDSDGRELGRIHICFMCFTLHKYEDLVSRFFSPPRVFWKAEGF